jgi:hypothetical protein
MRTLTGALVVTVLLAGGSLGLAQPVGLEPLLRDPVRYDQRPVIVTGTVAMVEGPSRAGAGLTPQAFLLMNGGVSIRVTAPPTPPVKPGDRVEVEGLFKLAGNTIEAFRVTFR